MARSAAERPSGFSIGTTAGITGLDPHTIRAWERRYGAVEPERSPGGARRYRDEDLVRLQLLKALVDRGEAIGSIAALPDDSLRERLARMSEIASSGAARNVPARPVLATLAPGVAAQLAADPTSQARVRVCLSGDSVEPFVNALPRHECDIVLAELERLGDEPLAALGAIQHAARHENGDAVIVVLYEFATAAELTRLSRAGARLLRAPLRAAELLRAIDHFSTLDGASTLPAPQLPALHGAAPAPDARSARIFDDEQLARLLETSMSVECECPSHLAALVSSVLSFERYSASCESRNEPDAALHHRLAISSSRIRADLESLLEQVCRHEGLLS